MIEQFRVAAVRSIKQLAEVLKPVERFYPLIGAIGTEPIYDLDETFFEGVACQIQVTVLDFVEIPIDDDSDDLDIYGYTQIGRPTVVFGEGGSGNSYWAPHLACTVAASGKRVGVAGLQGRPQRLAKTSARDAGRDARYPKRSWTPHIHQGRKRTCPGRRTGQRSAQASTGLPDCRQRVFLGFEDFRR